jgi:hypothetical protein
MTRKYKGVEKFTTHQYGKDGLIISMNPEIYDNDPWLCNLFDGQPEEYELNNRNYGKKMRFIFPKMPVFFHYKGKGIIASGEILSVIQGRAKIGNVTKHTSVISIPEMSKKRIFPPPQIGYINFDQIRYLVQIATYSNTCITSI